MSGYVTLTFTDTSDSTAVVAGISPNISSDTVQSVSFETSTCLGLGPGDTCTADFAVFAPSTKGHFSGTLDVSWGSTAGPQQHSYVSFSGSAIVPR